MNKVILMGRLTREPEFRDGQTPVTRYTLAVDRFKDGADFIPCVAFGKAAQFADTYLHKGTKIIVTGRIQTGSYKNKDGQTIYTTDVVIENQEFCESKSATAQPTQTAPPEGDFVKIPDGINEELPFR